MRPLFNSPCSKLSEADRVNRLAHHLWQHGERGERTPGCCKVCGHQLPSSYRMSRVVKDSDPIQFEHRECAPGSDDEKALLEYRDAGKISHGPPMDKPNAWHYYAITACEGLTEAVWAQAQQINRQRRSDISSTQQKEATVGPVSRITRI